MDAKLSEEALPVAPSDLRETFDLPLMMEEDRPKSPGGRAPAATDAAALFEDTPAVRRRPTGAAARHMTRRCSCGGVVPPGMSLCARCGLDLDTGQRHVMEDVLDDAPAPTVRSSGPPFAIVLIGTVALIASVLLTILSLLQWRQGLPGAQLLGVVCLFGVFASVQFLRGKSAKPLLAALLLGAAVDIIALVILPVWVAQNSVDEGAAPPPGVTAPNDETDDGEARIPSYNERLQATGGTKKITWGIIILMIDGAIFVYLSTSGVRRHFERPAFMPGVPPC